MRRAQRQKLYVKRMTHHLFHSVRYPFGRPTIVREVAVIKELERAGVIVPKIVFGEAVKIEGEWRALLVTEDMAGSSALLTGMPGMQYRLILTKYGKPC